jgi:hypothetical protein
MGNRRLSSILGRYLKRINNHSTLGPNGAIAQCSHLQYLFIWPDEAQLWRANREGLQS